MLQNYILKPFEQQRIEQTIEKLPTKQYVNSAADKNKLEPQNHQNINTHTKQTVLPIEVDERIHVLNVEYCSQPSIMALQPFIQ